MTELGERNGLFKKPFSLKNLYVCVRVSRLIQSSKMTPLKLNVILQ